MDILETYSIWTDVLKAESIFKGHFYLSHTDIQMHSCSKWENCILNSFFSENTPHVEEFPENWL